MIPLLAFVAFGQAPVPLVDLPFERYADQIWLKASMNDKPIYAILDSGASETVIDVDRIPPGATNGGKKRFGGNGSSSVVGYALDGVKVNLGGAALDTPALYAIPLYGLSPDDGHIPGAILGYGFFRSHVVEIDYAASHVRVYEAATYDPPKGFETLPIQFIDRVPTVEGRLKLPEMEERTVVMEIDTGSAFGVDVGYRMVLREGLEKRLRKFPTTESSGVIGGTRRSRPVGSVDGKLGSFPFSAVGRLILTGQKMTTRDYDYDVTLGDEVLRRFTIVFDYSRSHVYLKPNGK